MRPRNGGYSTSGSAGSHGGYSASGGANYTGGYSAQTQGSYPQPGGYNANYGGQEVTVSRSHATVFGGRHYHQRHRGYEPLYDDDYYPQPLCGCTLI